MKTSRLSILFLFFVLSFGSWTRGEEKCSSPNGKIQLEYDSGQYRVLFQNRPVIDITSVGIKTDLRGENWRFYRWEKGRRIREDYRMISGKRSHCVNEAQEYIFHYQDVERHPMRLVFRLYNDGIAFRYEMSDLKSERLKDEMTTYRINEGVCRWIQKWTEPYEEFFPLSTSGQEDRHWGYPALIEPEAGMFALITEANIGRRQSASSLQTSLAADLYKVSPATNPTPLQGEWHTPWRVVLVGSLADVVGSTLVTDVSEPCRLAETEWITPGVVSWIYWAYNRGSKDYQIVKEYIDMAHSLHLPYVLIDWEWDIMGNGGTIDDALRYAEERNVKVLLWYNSSTAWTTHGAGGPLFKLNKPEDREQEFAMLARRGVAGVKIDFFSGDLQATMDYCIDLIESAARHHLLINLHGATIPRGWQRTYPNLLTTEAVYGAEWYNNRPDLTTRAAAHNATLPFTRNVIGSMDYTPCTFSDSQHPHITTHAHELALTVLFESGLQHLADKPQSYLAQPMEVQTFLSRLPSAWDETRLLSGYPGDYVVLARRKGDKWYVAGINGADQPREITVDLKPIVSGRYRMKSFCDGTEPGEKWSITSTKSRKGSYVVSCLPRGGFVWVIEK